MISLAHLLQNKRAAGRHKDLDDLENLSDNDGQAKDSIQS